MKVRSTALPAASDNEREGGLGKRKRETDRGALEAGRAASPMRVTLVRTRWDVGSN